ncbi:amino acid permease [candidate division CSSED10-310 bacterium]|uniref:Amino acid permease n=1 Tax=candidate division CSSED10-310 bacterium TaxID=2855610 RepID=A0ABV6YWZ0_UNCC1
MAEQLQFKRNIGLFMAVMIGIGAMMGPGIFALPGELAHMLGPAGILVYLAMGLLTLFTALNYSELGAAIPLAGGGYSFTSRTMPRPLAFFTGWFFWIGNTLACAMYAVIFGLTIRTYFIPDVSIALLAIVTTLIFTALNFRGMSEAIKVITVMNLIELAVLIGIAVLGSFHIEPRNLQPLAPMGWAPFVPAMALIYISYVGFELITVAAEEIISPGKTIPRAILITLAVGVVIYVFVVWVMMGTVHHTELAQSEVPFIFTADRLFGAWGRWAGIIATIMASLSAFCVTLGASARVLYALGRDGHFPHFFARLHPTYRTPHIALFICAVIVILFGSSGIVKFVASVSDFGYLMGLGIVNFAVIMLHRRMPNLRRPFKVFLYPYIPILGVITCWIFVPALELRSFVLGGILTIIGAAIYLFRPINRAEFKTIPLFFKKLKRTLLLKRRKSMRVLIVGGGRQGQNIAKRLSMKDEFRMMFRSTEHQITFIEEDEKLCKEIEHQFNVPIYQGDGTKAELLEQVGRDNIDVAIAASEDDGRNVIVAFQAKRLGIDRVIAVIQDPDYISLLTDNDVIAISSPWATAAMVENFLDRPGVAQLFEIGAGVASLVGVFVPENAAVAGKLIRDIDIPQECVVAAVIRQKTFVVPRGDTVINADDRVIFVGPASAIKKAQDTILLKNK